MYRCIAVIGICFSYIFCVSGAPISSNRTVCEKEDLFAVCNLVPNPNNPGLINGTLYFIEPVTSDCQYDFLSIQVEIDIVPTVIPTNNNKGLVQMDIDNVLKNNSTNKNGLGQVEKNNVSPKKETHMHGLHVHTYGDMTNGCESMGGHYNPHNSPHGYIWKRKEFRHVGDLGNVAKNKEGKVKTRIVDHLASLHGTESIIGRGIVLHAGKDDLGMNKNDPGSLRTGNAGARIACCVIGQSDTINRLKFSLYG